ncbi:histidine kinase dimerization/phospho-acceptor domain-containing protein, partial [Candidatus Kuenenia stuttgartensis]
MASGIAHELNNILAVIDANIQLLIKESKGRIKLLQALSIIREQCIDGAEVVRRMKEFTSTSVDPRKMIQVNMNSLVNNIIVFTKPL